MTERKKGFFDGLNHPGDRTISVAAAATIEASVDHIHIGGGGTYDVTLPAAELNKGKTITLDVISAPTEVTVIDGNAAGTTVISGISLTTQKYLLVSNGVTWLVYSAAGLTTGLSAAQEVLSAAAPAAATDGTSTIDSNGNAVDATLAAGSVIGQMKLFVMTEASNSSTVTIAAHETTDPEEATFDAVDEYGLFMWTGTEWVTVANSCTFV